MTAVYHLHGNTAWSSVVVKEGTHQNSKWKFSMGCGCSTFPRTFAKGDEYKPKVLELLAKIEQLERTFSVYRNFVWEYWSTFQEILFSPEIFRLVFPVYISTDISEFFG